jgi:hypothetical protein
MNTPSRRVLKCGALRQVRLPSEAVSEVALDLRDAASVLDRALPAVHDHARQLEAMVVVLADQVVRVEQLLDALEREEARLGHDDELRGGGEGVDRQKPETRRAVDEHDVTRVQLMKVATQDKFIRRSPSRLAGGERRLGRRKREAPLRCDQHVTEREAAWLEHHVRDRRPLVDIDAEDLRCRRLGIQVNDEHCSSAAGKLAGKRKRDGRLADSSLLVRDRVGLHGHPSLHAGMRVHMHEEADHRPTAPRDC